MNICWVVADKYSIDPAVDADQLKSIGPIWGSYTTWRSCCTDNVICHDKSRSHDLVTRDFHKKSNFYTHKEYYQFLGRPSEINLYDGEFQSAVDSIEDIIAMHLSSSTADIVLLLGFDFGESVPPVDHYDLHKWTNRRGLINSIILNTPEIQWLAVDQNNSLSTTYAKLPNLSCDKLKNVLQLLAHEN
jgi:hypothetical protein